MTKNLAILRRLLLARLADQPPAFAYPQGVLETLHRTHTRWIERAVGQRQRYPWLEWECDDARHDYGRLAKAGLLNDRRLVHQISRHNLSIDYAIGRVPFMGLDIMVRPPILIPRADTEAWLRSLLKFDTGAWKRILEVGTGTGCIALTLAKALPTADIDAIDIDKRAIRLARANQVLNGSPQNLQIDRESIFQLRDCHYDLIISNPPYIRRVDRLPRVAPSVRRWEASVALHGGDPDGLAFHRHLIRMMVDKGVCRYLALEFDGSRRQLSSLHDFIHQIGPDLKVTYLRDEANKPRAILINCPYF